MKIRTSHILVPLLATVAVAAFAGSIAGTISWYAYSTRVRVSYQGTSVMTTEQLQIGLEVDEEFKDSFTADFGEFLQDNSATTPNPEASNTSGKYYVWAKPGVGLPSGFVAKYAELHGYAANELPATTSKLYDDTHKDLTLWSAPLAHYATNNKLAATSEYCYVPFVFRILTTNESGDSYAQGQNIWITNVVAAAGQENSHIYEALRVYVDGTLYSKGEGDVVTTSSQKYILNGSSEEETAGQTKLYGPLDLDGDGFYDDDGAYERGKEIIYGELHERAAKEAELASKTALAEDSELDNVNGVKDELKEFDSEHNETGTTFIAKHKEGNKCTDKTFVNGLTGDTATYETIKTIEPTMDSASKKLVGGKPICTTAFDESGIAKSFLTIYLEGWDHSVVDSQVSHGFNLGLQFEINKV